MDITWVTDRIAVGGGIWNDQNMTQLVRQGVTHIINMQVEFDDRQLADGHPVEILHNPTDDDFQPKPPQLFQPAIEFALQAINDAGGANRVFIHCAAGVHRAPMMTLALLRVQGWSLKDAQQLIQKRRYVVDFADVYVKSVEEFVRTYESARTENPKLARTSDPDEPSDFAKMRGLYPLKKS
jgi:protein-tyrosine phosphatase